jgi:hypothetical protein
MNTAMRGAFAKLRSVSREDGESLARRFHTAYEYWAPFFDYETRADTREFDPLSNNGKLMIAVCRQIIAEGLTNDR